MPVPSTMQDLALAAASNFPTGGEAIGTSLDDYLRSHGSIIRSTASISTSTIASAATTNIASSDAEQVTVTGTTTITSLGTGFAGCRREVQFSGALTLTHSANLILPGAANFTTAANDVVTFRCIAAGQWICSAISRGPTNFSSIAITGLSTYNGNEIGYIGIPRVTGGFERGKMFAISAGVTINGDSAGNVFCIYNDSAAAVTLTQGVGITLRLGGTTSTGNRTLAARGIASIWFNTATECVITGHVS